jgi:hypothetical protein
MGKRATLSDFTTRKAEAPPPAAEPEAPPPKAPKVDNRKLMTLRLEAEAWKQLKQLALDTGCTSHDLIVEGVNLVFGKHGRPPIA